MKEESKREFSEKQTSDYERLKSDEVLTLKESANIDHLVASKAAMSSSPQRVPIVPGQAPPTQGKAAPVMAGTQPAVTQQNQSLPMSYQMAAPLNEAELTTLLMASPLYQKLEQLKKKVSSGALAAGLTKMPSGNAVSKIHYV